ncbi:MAG: TRAP transporter permease [Micrococcaceae bacterium]
MITTTENEQQRNGSELAPANTLPMSPASPEADKANTRLTPGWRAAIMVLTVLGILLTMNQVFFWNLLGLSLPTNAFLYLLCACFLPIVLMVQPLRKVDPARAEGIRPPEVQAAAAALSGRTIPWYDMVLMLLVISCCVYLAVNSIDITVYGWSFMAPGLATGVSFVFWALIVEVLRRAAGWIIAVIALAVSLYPVVAGAVPIGFLQGISYDLDLLARVHVMGSDSILGLPLQTAGSILVGFLLFGVVLQHTGGAAFFHDLSMALFGRYRGGSAKVSVASSAAMGMMSGSAVSNVLTTGPMTIPAMVRSGFTPRTAGAVEATASSGGSITPPIMGTAAFLMVSFVGVPYTSIIVAAIIPAVLYFLGIFLQIDGFAALKNLKGTRKELLPRISTALIAGWPYLGTLGLLVVLLFVLGSESQVPFYVVGVLLVIALVKPGQKFGARQWADMLLDIGKTLAQIIGLIAGVGLILGGLTATGVALSLSRDIVALVGENVVPILIVGAIACFIMGMGLTISAAYVFLAIVMAPALITLGVDPIAAHLFVIYWASVSYITPPVGLAAFAAAGISKASPMGTCFEAMRLGAVKYIVPFGFALNPALVAQAPLIDVFLAGTASIVAVFALACAFSGWLILVEVKLGWVLRIPLMVGGFMIFLPQYSMSLIGLGVCAAVAILAWLNKRGRSEKLDDDGSLGVQSPTN